MLGTSIQSIRSIQSQLKELDKAIERILDGISSSQCLRSIPGIDRSMPQASWPRSATSTASRIKPPWPSMRV
nr:hypothetical protein [Paenibacillus melissococcoides]